MVFFLLSAPWLAHAQATTQDKGSRQPVAAGSVVNQEETAGDRQEIIREGIAVELHIDPVDAGKKAARLLMEGDDVTLEFKITDTATGVPMSGLRPAAWVDPRVVRMDPSQGVPSSEPCKDKIQSFLQGSLAFQPAIDLNTYYILALNDQPSISVINPQLGFYVTKLVTTVPLNSPGEDWVLNREGKRLFVTMPKANQVAVVDTATWKVLVNLDIAPNPMRIALQPDERYLWIATDSSGEQAATSGVTVFDPDKLKAVTYIPTGPGHHEIIFADDSKYAFVSNQESGSVTVIDTQQLAKIKEIKTGAMPASQAYSSRAKALYVADGADGKITVVDGKSLEVVARIQAQPGLRAIRFSPDGRWAFLANTRENVVNIIDSSLNRIVYTVEVDPRPDQIAFSRAFAYIRTSGSDNVNAIQLSLLGKSDTISPMRFPAGQPPERSQFPSIADAIVPTPEGDVVLVTNPVEKTIYYYMEGMLAPMGNFQNYGSEPRAALVVNRSLQETAPGVYATTFKLPDATTYDVAFLLDSPRLYHCFQMTVKKNPVLTQKGLLPLKIEVLTKERNLKVGEPLLLRLKVTNPRTEEARIGLKDLRVLYYLIPGIWQKRVFAQALGDGVYEVELRVPRPGNYNILFECQSLGVRYNQMPHVLMQATEAGK
jgi:YVTN family beta-propeller protein